MNKTNPSGFPGMSAMTDTLDFMKNMWGGMSAPGVGIPGIVMPTLSVEEISKQIKDLKAVESWLTVNMTMLRSTIQALEVQSATISTLQAMGQSFSDAVKSGSAADAPKPDPVRGQHFTTPTAPDDDELEDEEADDEAPEDEAPVDTQTADAPAAPNAKAATGDFAQPMPNPAAWWSMLQDQFKQAVGTAMVNEPTAAATPAAKKTKPAVQPKPKAKPAPKAKSKPAPNSKASTKPVQTKVASAKTQSSAPSTRKPKAFAKA